MLPKIKRDNDNIFCSKKGVTVNFLFRTASLVVFVVLKQAISYLELLTVDRHIYSINGVLSPSWQSTQETTKYFAARGHMVFPTFVRFEDWMNYGFPAKFIVNFTFQPFLGYPGWKVNFIFIRTFHLREEKLIVNTNPSWFSGPNIVPGTSPARFSLWGTLSTIPFFSALSWRFSFTDNRWVFWYVNSDTWITPG